MATMNAVPSANRTKVRWSVDERGIVWVGQQAVDCKIIDLTVAGAQISIDDASRLPSRVELERGGCRSKARVVWQRGDAVAIEFDRRLRWLKKLGLSALLRRSERGP